MSWFPNVRNLLNRFLVNFWLPRVGSVKWQVKGGEWEVPPWHDERMGCRSSGFIGKHQ